MIHGTNTEQTMDPRCKVNGNIAKCNLYDESFTINRVFGKLKRKNKCYSALLYDGNCLIGAVLPLKAIVRKISWYMI